jgi:hypothetical protein
MATKTLIPGINGETKHSFGNLDARFYDFTFDGAYPAGGEPLSASALGMAFVLGVVPMGAAMADAGVLAAVVRYDHTNEKLQAGVSAGDGDAFDEAGAADVDTLKVRLLVLGHSL